MARCARVNEDAVINVFIRVIGNRAIVDGHCGERCIIGGSGAKRRERNRIIDWGNTHAERSVGSASTAQSHMHRGRRRRTMGQRQSDCQTSILSVAA